MKKPRLDCVENSDSQCMGRAIAIVTVAIFSLASRAEQAPVPEAATSPKLTKPIARALKLEPPSLTLLDGRDEHRVIVWGKTDAGQWADVSAQAVLKPDSDSLIVDEFGIIHGKRAG